jgi:hypothetical protein
LPTVLFCGYPQLSSLRNYALGGIEDELSLLNRRGYTHARRRGLMSLALESDKMGVANIAALAKNSIRPRVSFGTIPRVVKKSKR